MTGLWIPVAVAVLMASAVIAYEVNYRIVSRRPLPEEKGQQPILSVRSLIRSSYSDIDAAGGGHDTRIYTARLTVYREFVVIKARTALIFKRGKIAFVLRRNRFKMRLFINEGALGNDTEIMTGKAKIIPALKAAGYLIQEQG